MNETLAFRLELRAISKETAEAAERLTRAINKLVEKELAEGYHTYSLYINWPLVHGLQVDNTSARASKEQG